MKRNIESIAARKSAQRRARLRKAEIRLVNKLLKEYGMK